MRTIESLVESHRVARARIAAGKPVWDRSVNIKSILHRDPTNTTEAYAAGVANEIGQLLRAKLPKDVLDGSRDVTDIIEIVENLESLTPTSYADDPTYSVIEDLNNLLYGLYDWADRERVWLGF